MCIRDSSLLALGIAFLTYLDQRRSNRRLQAVEERRDQVAIDRKKSAVLIAQIHHESADFGTNCFLEIANRGQAPAQQIGMKLDEICASKLEYIHDPMMNELGANSSKRYRLCLNPGQCAPTHIALTWIDGTGQAKKYTSTL